MGAGSHLPRRAAFFRQVLRLFEFSLRKPCIAFAIYIISVFYFTGTGTLYDILHYRFEITQKLNFMPFSNEIDIVAYLQNILLFIPFGILLPFYGKSKIKCSIFSYQDFHFQCL